MVLYPFRHSHAEIRVTWPFLIVQKIVPGSTAALALLNDAVKKGGAFASSSVGGLSGAFIPVSEDLNISQAVRPSG